MSCMQESPLTAPAAEEVVAVKRVLLSPRLSAEHTPNANPSIESLLWRRERAEAGSPLDEVTPLLDPVPGIDLDEYRRTLLERFGNAAIGDQLRNEAIRFRHALDFEGCRFDRRLDAIETLL